MPLVLLAMLLCLTTGCIKLGKAGVLGFDYDARDRFLGRDAPDTALAVGAHADLNVYSRAPPVTPPGDEADGLRGVTRKKSPTGFDLVDVLRASSSIPDVVRLDPPAGPRVRVHGVRPGFSDISVESALGGDTVTVSVAEVAAATIDHWLFDMLSKKPSAGDTAFVRGGTGRFVLSMRDASGRAVVGAGVVPPITVEPAAAAEIAEIASGDLRHVEIRFDRAGAVALGMARRDPLRVAVIEPSSVTSLEIVALDIEAGDIVSPSTVRRGRGLGVAVRGVLQDGRRVLLLGDVARIAGATPEVCATPADQTERVRLIFGDGVTAVDALSPGTCTLVATLPPLRAEVNLTVEPAPAPSGSDSIPSPPASGTSRG